MSEGNDFVTRLGLDYSNFIRGFSRATAIAASSSAKLSDTINSKIKKPMQDAGKASEDFSAKTEKSFKSVSRVVQGILISQMFYRMVAAMKQATAAVFETAKAFEVANISFSILLNNTEKAKRMLTVLEDFAAITPFTIQDSRLAAQRLMAMGIAAENTVPMLRAILDASTMTGGGAESIERVSEALGKINTMGRVTQRQLIQLALAGIPAYAILEEKLGLTKDQLKDLGKLRIPADIGLKALIDGIEERFGGVSKAVSRSMTGLISTMKDDLLLLARYVTAGPYEKLRNYIEGVTNRLEELRTAYKQGGLGGVFNAIVPADMQLPIKLFLANLRILADNVGEIFRQIKPWIAEFGKAFITVMNVVLPILNAVTRAFLFLSSMINYNNRIVRFFVSTLATLFILAGVTVLVLTFRKALMGLMIVQVIYKMIYELARAIVVLTTAMLSNGWIALFMVLAGGLSIVALNSNYAKNALSALGAEFNKIFRVDTGGMFKVTDQQGLADQSEFNKGLTVSQESMDKLTDANEKAKKSARDVFASFDEVFTLAEDAAADKESPFDLNMDEDLMQALNMPDVALPDGGGLQMPDYVPPSNTGLFTDFWKNLWKSICDSWDEEWKGSIEKTKQSWENIKTFWRGIWKAVCDSWNEEWRGSVEKTKQSWKDFKQFWQDLWASVSLWYTDTKTKFLAWCDETGVKLNAWYQDHKAKFLKWCDETSVKLNAWYQEHKTGFLNWYTETKKNLSNWWDESKIGFSDWYTNTKANLGTWWEENKTGFLDWYNGTKAHLSTWWEENKTGFLDWYDSTKANLNTWWEENRTGFLNWYNETKVHLSNWWEENKVGFADWYTETKGSVDKWFSDTKAGFATWYYENKAKLNNWWYETKNGFSTWAEGIYTGVFSWFDKIGTIFDKLIAKLKFWGKSNISFDTSVFSSGLEGHAAGGVFSKEHFARFAEGNKPEMIVPTGSGADTAKVVSMMLDNGLRAAFENAAGQSNQPIMYVGTLIADDRSLKELERRMTVVRKSESNRIVGGTR